MWLKQRARRDEQGNPIPLLDAHGRPKLDRHGKPLYEPWLDRQGRPRWEAQVYAGRHPETRQPQFVRKTFVRKTDALAWGEEQQGLKRSNTRPPTTRETFAHYLREWLKVYATQIGGTTYNYEKTLGKWVLDPKRRGMPQVGAKALRDLDTQDFNRLYTYMAGLGMTRAVGYLHGILKRALKAAVQDGTLPRNPAATATVPKVRPKAEILTEADEDQAGEVVRSLTQEQANQFLAAARDLAAMAQARREKDPDFDPEAVYEAARYVAFFHIQLTGGLRPGETLALKWRHVDWKDSLVKVRASLTRLGLKGGWKLKEPKTKHSRRDVPLPALTMQRLGAWKKLQAEQRLRAGKEWKDHDFVFTTATGEPLDKQVHAAFRRICAKAGLGTWGPEPVTDRAQYRRVHPHGPLPPRPFTPAFRLYDLRHTSVTLALLNGEDLLKVSRRHGHSSPMFTADRYAHVKAADTKSTADLMEKLFAPSHNPLIMPGQTGPNAASQGQT